ncbi:MAG TPA: hypothetical protein VNX68_04895, partial [Nitrosopumilaceae archaeon]|nr:hypothetical protein [Nitrosopumilaceae archaeon]
HNQTYKSRKVETTGYRKTKTQDINEEELKRRKYYGENYKTAPKPKSSQKPEPSRYNETWYILYSIPVAVALLFFIINRYGNSNSTPETNPINHTDEVGKKSEKTQNTKKISTSDSPYLKIFGKPQINKLSDQVIEVYNHSGYDAIVCLVNSQTGITVRHYYIANTYNLLFEYIPEGNYVLKNYIGKVFNSKKTMLDTMIAGGFDLPKQFQLKKQNKVEISFGKRDTFWLEIDVTNKKAEEISETEFFKNNF